MYILVISIIIFIAILLILVILAQNSKGGGLSSQFGGSGASNMIGVKKTGDILEKITWGLAIGILALTLSTKFMVKPVQSNTDEFIDRAQEQTVLPGLDLDIPETDPEGETGGEEGSLDDLSVDPEEGE